jgi:hypothetical protein
VREGALLHSIKMRTLTVAALGLALAGACSRFEGSGAEGAAGPEAGVPTDGAFAGPGDSGVEAAPSSAGFCNGLRPAPTFCNDFDEVGHQAGDGFSSKTGVFSLDTNEAVSPPASLRAGADATLHRAFVGGASEISLHFKVRVTANEDGGTSLASYAYVAWVLTGSQRCRFGISLRRNALELEYEAQGTQSDSWPMTRNPRLDAWMQIHLVLYAAAGKIHARLDMDGKEMVPDSVTPCVDMAEGVELTMGLMYGRGELRLDDIALDMK